MSENGLGEGDVTCPVSEIKLVVELTLGLGVPESLFTAVSTILSSVD